MHERRSTVRVSYPIRQRVRQAEEHAVSSADFESHLFHDVSLGGCSFWSTRPLRGQRLSIELGLDHNHLTRLAEVCHETEIQCLARPLYRVGCRFLPPN
jgi:hypothetical protein